MNKYKLPRARRLFITMLSLASAGVFPLALPAQQAQPRVTAFRIGAGLSYQAASRASIANTIGAHARVGIMRRQSAMLAVGGEAAYHGFVGQGCEAVATCTWGADWIGHAGAVALFEPRPGSFPVYGMGGIGAYYGGQSREPASLRPGGSIGLGVVVLRREERMLAVEVRYHRFTSDIAGTSYLVPATVSLTW